MLHAPDSFGDLRSSVWPSFSLSTFVYKAMFLRTPVLRGVEWLSHEKMIPGQLSLENTTYSIFFCGGGEHHNEYEQVDYEVL